MHMHEYKRVISIMYIDILLIKRDKGEITDIVDIKNRM